MDIRLVPLAEKLTAECLSELGCLRGYERDLRLYTVTDPNLELELRQTIWELYRQWAASAEELYRRGRMLRGRGADVREIDRLNDEIGRVQARLTVKPEQLVNARQQAREGHFIPARELRDELNARLHP